MADTKPTLTEMHAVLDDLTDRERCSLRFAQDRWPNLDHSKHARKIVVLNALLGVLALFGTFEDKVRAFAETLSAEWRRG